MTNNNSTDPEQEIKCRITDIEKKCDKHEKDYWIIRTSLESYLAFSTDYHLSPQALSLLTNYPHQIVNKCSSLNGQKER